MALSANPISSGDAAALAAANPFKNTPSYSGSDSSLATGAGSSLLGGSGNSYVATSSGTTPGVPSNLSINPLASLVSNVSNKITEVQISAEAALPKITDAMSKVNLNATISRLSGAAGSPLNGMTGDMMSAAKQLTGKLADNPLQGLQTLAGSASNIAADISGTLNKLAGGNLAGGLQKLAGTVSGAAGQLSNILSLRRGVNLPAGGETFDTFGSEITLLPESSADWRVKISCNWEMFNSPMFDRLKDSGGVVWPYLPSITVSTKAEYTKMETTHSNYPFQAYKNSQVDDIEIAGEFSCETEADAEYWIAATTFFKTATKMFFGQGQNQGHPPIICRLTGYGSSIFDNIPVVVKSFSVSLPDDVDYILYTPTNTWVPILSTISVTVSPIYNRERLRKFSLEDYASGGLINKQTGNDVGYI